MRHTGCSWAESQRRGGESFRRIVRESREVRRISASTTSLPNNINSVSTSCLPGNINIVAATSLPSNNNDFTIPPPQNTDARTPSLQNNNVTTSPPPGNNNQPQTAPPGQTTAAPPASSPPPRDNTGLNAFRDNITITSWNCQGFGATSQAAYDRHLAGKADVAVLVDAKVKELPRRRTPGTYFSAAESGPGKKKAAAIIIKVSQELRKSVIFVRAIGSSILKMKIRGCYYNIIIYGVYLPHRGRSVREYQGEVKLLSEEMSKDPRRDCVIVVGDQNCRLGRAEGGSDSEMGKHGLHREDCRSGKFIRNLMINNQLRHVGSHFQLPRGAGRETFRGAGTGLISEIDHILCSKRWFNSVRSFRISWAPSITRHGQKQDHAALPMTLDCKRKAREEKKMGVNWRSLKNKERSAAFDRRLEEILENSPHQPSPPADAPAVDSPPAAIPPAGASHTVLPSEYSSSGTSRLAEKISNDEGDIDAVYVEMVEAMKKAAADTLPRREEEAGHSIPISEETRKLIEKREEVKAPRMKRAYTKLIRRARRIDRRKEIRRREREMEKHFKAGRLEECFRVLEDLCGGYKARGGKEARGVEEWHEYAKNKFAAPEEPDLTDQFQQPPYELDGETLERMKTPPSFAEVRKAARLSANNRSPGSDGLPAEVWKYSDNSQALLHALTERAWKTGTLPAEMSIVEFVMIFKGKGSEEVKDGWRSIGLINTSTKCITRWCATRIIELTDQLLSPSQNGFRPGRGTRDCILAVRSMMRAVLDSGEEAILVLIDYKAAFDRLSHQYIFKALRAMGIPENIVRICEGFYKAAKGVVRTADGKTPPFEINVGVIQGDSCSPLLFILALDLLLKSQELPVYVDGVAKFAWQGYADDLIAAAKTVEQASTALGSVNAGSVPTNLKINFKKTMSLRVQEDAAARVGEYTAAEKRKLPHACPRCRQRYACKHGLAVHRGRFCTGKFSSRVIMGTKSQKLMQENRVREAEEERAASDERVAAGDERIDMVSRAVYLGSLLVGSGRWEPDLQHRLQIANLKFDNLKPVLLSKSLSIRIRLRVFVICVATALLYGSDCWEGQVEKQLAELRKISVKFAFKMLMSRRGAPGLENVRKLAAEIDLPGMFLKRKLTWFGTLVRSEVDTLSKKVAMEDRFFFEPFFFGEKWEDVVSRAEDADGWTEWVEKMVGRQGMRKITEKEASA